MRQSFPSLRSAQTDVLVVLDTSGSIRQDEMREFVTEIGAIKGQVRARITLHACDAALSSAGPWVFEPWEEFELPADIRGGGGTRFTPVFEWIERENLNPDLLVYFTDAEGEFPEAGAALSGDLAGKGARHGPLGTADPVELNGMDLPLIEWVTHQIRRDACLLMARLLAE